MTSGDSSSRASNAPGTSGSAYTGWRTELMFVVGAILTGISASLLVFAFYKGAGLWLFLSPPGTVVLMTGVAGLILVTAARARGKSTARSRRVSGMPILASMVLVGAFWFEWWRLGMGYNPLFMQEEFPEGVVGCWSLFASDGRRANKAFYAAPAATRLDTLRTALGDPSIGGVKRFAYELDSLQPPHNRSSEHDPLMGGRWGVSPIRKRIAMNFGFLSTVSLVFDYPGGADRPDTLFGRAAGFTDSPPPHVERLGKAYAVRVSCDSAPIPPVRALVPMVRSVVTLPVNVSIPAGGTITISSSVDADSGLANTVTWSTVDSSVAVVDFKGVVTAVGARHGEKVSICATSTANPAVRGCSQITIIAK